MVVLFVLVNVVLCAAVLELPQRMRVNQRNIYLFRYRHFPPVILLLYIFWRGNFRYHYFLRSSFFHYRLNGNLRCSFLWFSLLHFGDWLF